jgi:group I intron endonuclease
MHSETDMPEDELPEEAIGQAEAAKAAAGDVPDAEGRTWVDWVEKDVSEKEVYRYFMRTDPGMREFLGPIETIDDPVTGTKMRTRWAKIAMLRGKSTAFDTLVYLDPWPHIRLGSAKPLQGWYSGRWDGAGQNQRDRPCFLPGTNVDTPFGPRKIENIVPGEIVFGYDINSRRKKETLVLGTATQIKTEYLEVELENGKVLKVTPEHMFFTTNRGWVEAQHLTFEDDIQEIGRHKGPCVILKSGVYALVNRINGKVYVGSSKNITYRLRRHYKDLVKGIHWNAQLQSSYTRGDDFCMVVLEFCDVHDLIDREQYWMDELHSRDNNFGYNRTDAGRTVLSPEVVERIAVLKRGRTYDEMYGVERAAVIRKSISRTGATNPNWRGGDPPKPPKGRKILSPAHKKAIGVGLRKGGKQKNGSDRPEIRAKISSTLKQKYLEGLPLTAAQLNARKSNGARRSPVTGKFV